MAPDETTDRHSNGLTRYVTLQVSGLRERIEESLGRLKDGIEGEHNLRVSEEKRLEEKTNHLKELWQQHEKSADRALELQAGKDKEHMEALNHVERRNQEKDSKYLQGDKFEDYIKSEEDKFNQYKRDREQRDNERFGGLEKSIRDVERVQLLHLGGQQKMAQLVGIGLAVITVMNIFVTIALRIWLK